MIPVAGMSTPLALTIAEATRDRQISVMRSRVPRSRPHGCHARRRGRFHRPACDAAVCGCGRHRSRSTAQPPVAPGYIARIPFPPHPDSSQTTRAPTAVKAPPRTPRSAPGTAEATGASADDARRERRHGPSPNRTNLRISLLLLPSACLLVSGLPKRPLQCNPRAEYLLAETKRNRRIELSQVSHRRDNRRTTATAGRPNTLNPIMADATPTMTPATCHTTRNCQQGKGSSLNRKKKACGFRSLMMGSLSNYLSSSRCMLCAGCYKDNIVRPMVERKTFFFSSQFGVAFPLNAYFAYQ